jgi:hypothetical protein
LRLEHVEWLDYVQDVSNFNVDDVKEITENQPDVQFHLHAILQTAH